MRYELHCHSTYSDGTATPGEIVSLARGMGLSGVAVTDHDVIAGSLAALKHATEEFRVVPGMEVSSSDGHILALGVRELVAKDMPAEKTIEAIHALGGMAVAAHPYDRWRTGVGDLILKLPFDAVEVKNGHTFGNRKDPVRACLEAGLSMVGGSDAHTPGEIGLVTVEFEGTLESAVESGGVRVVSKPIHKLVFTHGAGMLRRRLKGIMR